MLIYLYLLLNSTQLNSSLGSIVHVFSTVYMNILNVVL